MNRVLCSTGALIGRPNGRNFRLLPDCAERISCDGFEFMMYDDWYEKREEIAELLKDFPKPFPVFHIEKGVGDLLSRNEPGDTELAMLGFEQNCILANQLGSRKLVIHLWSGMDSDKDFPHNIEMYRKLREISDRYQITLTVENVVCNHSDPMTHLNELVSLFPDIEFTYDTKMAEFHGQSDALYLPENHEVWKHVTHMHINDFKGAPLDWSCLKTLHAGEGQIDFEKLFRFINREGYQGDFTIESTSFDKTGVIDFEKLNNTICRIRGLKDEMR